MAGDARTLAELAHVADESGWDGFFVEALRLPGTHHEAERRQLRAVRAILLRDEEL